MKPGFPDYLKEAFNARPMGLLVPPNWIGIAAFGLLGVVNPGFWLIGAGLEAGYLLALSHLPRFRALVDGKFLASANQQGDQATEAIINKLDPARRERFLSLRQRCERILGDQQLESGSAVGQMQADGLGRLLGIHLQLLVTQSVLQRMLGESDAREIAAKIEEVRQDMATATPEGDLFRSLRGQIDILEKRQRTLTEGAEKLAFTESELDRIEHQIALIRDEVGLSAAPEAVGSQIDRISGELGETSQWISDQQRLFGDADLQSTITLSLNQPISQS